MLPIIWTLWKDHTIYHIIADAIKSVKTNSLNSSIINLELRL